MAAEQDRTGGEGHQMSATSLVGLDTETADKRAQMFGELETERDRLAAEVDNLRSFEREYRSRLKTYFTQQLEALSSGEGDASGDSSSQPKRLRSVLGDDEG